mmetsp:Transcript_47993/g.112008  ORF Transcript_47993/g.112008 Transcript_47993/m.112008 type:complete len:373 (-) Transcript_47993:551-1669(-)
MGCNRERRKGRRHLAVQEAAQQLLGLLEPLELHARGFAQPQAQPQAAHHASGSSPVGASDWLRVHAPVRRPGSLAATRVSCCAVQLSVPHLYGWTAPLPPSQYLQCCSGSLCTAPPKRLPLLRLTWPLAPCTPTGSSQAQSYASAMRIHESSHPHGSGALFSRHESLQPWLDSVTSPWYTPSAKPTAPFAFPYPCGCGATLRSLQPRTSGGAFVRSSRFPYASLDQPTSLPLLPWPSPRPPPQPPPAAVSARRQPNAQTAVLLSTSMASSSLAPCHHCSPTPHTSQHRHAVASDESASASATPLRRLLQHPPLLRGTCDATPLPQPPHASPVSATSAAPHTLLVLRADLHVTAQRCCPPHASECGGDQRHPA